LEIAAALSKLRETLSKKVPSLSGAMEERKQVNYLEIDNLPGPTVPAENKRGATTAVVGARASAMLW
jgi:hypothetical protein